MEPQSYGYTAQTKVGSVGYTYRPLINVEVGGEIKSRTFKALVDSGTEITVMDLSIAVLLGISSEGKPEGQLFGLEEWKKGFLAPVTLKFDKFEEFFTFSVLFVEDLHRNFEIILGQHDFFMNFDVTFQKSKNLFYLQRVPSLFPEKR